MKKKPTYHTVGLVPKSFRKIVKNRGKYGTHSTHIHVHVHVPITHIYMYMTANFLIWYRKSIKVVGLN